MRQPLDVGESEVLGGPQEAWAGDRVCVCPPGPDTSGTALCFRDGVTRVDAWPPLAVVTPGAGQGQGQCTMSCCPQESDRWSHRGSRAVTWAGSLVAPLLAAQGTVKSLLQPYSSNVSIPQCSAVFTVQLSYPHVTTGETIALSRWTFIGKICLCFLICCLG